MDEIETEQNFEKMKSASFKNSTPKKKTEFLRNKCEDCSNKSEFVERIVRRVSERHGGVSTASCTPSPWCLEMDSSPCSTS